MFYKDNGEFEGATLTLTDGSFHFTDTTEVELTAVLINPYTGAEVDTWTVFY